MNDMLMSEVGDGSDESTFNMRRMENVIDMINDNTCAKEKVISLLTGTKILNRQLDNVINEDIDETKDVVRCGCETLHHYQLRREYNKLFINKIPEMPYEMREVFSHLIANRDLIGTKYSHGVEYNINIVLDRIK